MLPCPIEWPFTTCPEARFDPNLLPKTLRHRHFTDCALLSLGFMTQCGLSLAFGLLVEKSRIWQLAMRALSTSDLTQNHQIKRQSAPFYRCRSTSKAQELDASAFLQCR
eukprot:3538504-Amphidinium_carterae.1